MFAWKSKVMARSNFWHRNMSQQMDCTWIFFFNLLHMKCLLFLITMTMNKIMWDSHLLTKKSWGPAFIQDPLNNHGLSFYGDRSQSGLLAAKLISSNAEPALYQCQHTTAGALIFQLAPQSVSRTPLTVSNGYSIKHWPAHRQGSPVCQCCNLQPLSCGPRVCYYDPLATNQSNKESSHTRESDN